MLVNNLHGNLQPSGTVVWLLRISYTYVCAQQKSATGNSVTPSEPEQVVAIHSSRQQTGVPLLGFRLAAHTFFTRVTDCYGRSSSTIVLAIVTFKLPIGVNPMCVVGHCYRKERSVEIRDVRPFFGARCFLHGKATDT